MARNFSLERLRRALGPGSSAAARDPRVVMRIVLGALLLAIVVAAAFVFRPWGGSEEDLQREATSLQLRVQQRRATLERLRTLAATIDKARVTAREFVGTQFLDRQTAFSTLEGELIRLSEQAGVRTRDRSYNIEPVDGTDLISLMTITANFEATYADLVQFLNLLDRSRHLLIVDSLRAAPQQGDMVLAVSMKINTFVREDGVPLPVAPASGPAAVAPASREEVQP